MSSLKNSYADILTKEYLLEEYVNKKRFAKDISKDLGCSNVTVANYLKKYGIKIETRYAERDNKGLNPARHILTEEYLKKEYVEKARSMTNIARELNCSVALVSEYLTRFGINKINNVTPSVYADYISEDKGYILIRLPNHRLSNYRGYVRLHVLLAEYYYDRKVEEDEVVHHINGDIKDNSPHNLEILKKRQHDRYHINKRWAEGNFKRVEKVCRPNEKMNR